jgi:hypothetical protein
MKTKKIPVLNKATIMRFRTKFKSGNEDDCWEWEGCTRHGYGAFSYQDMLYRAHRISYTINKGEIPDGILVLHKCDNKACVNPNHLFLGDQVDNIKDMFNKNRANRISGEGNHNAKLSDSDVLLIRQSISSAYTLSRKLGVSEVYINQIKRGFKRKNG